MVSTGYGQIWVKGHEANKISTLRNMEGMSELVDKIIYRIFYQLSLVLAPGIADDKRATLISLAADNLTRRFANRMSLTAFAHCADLIINSQPPFDKEVYSFDVRAISGFLQRYLIEQGERVQAAEYKPLGAAQRSYLLARAMFANEETANKFKELTAKLEAKFKPIQVDVTSQQERYLTLADYFYQNEIDPDMAERKLMAQWTEAGQDPIQASQELLTRLNAGETLQL